MSIVLNIALFVLLILAFYQDKKQRSIHLSIFLGLGLVATGFFVLTEFNWSVVVQNVLFTVIVITGLTLYISLKEQRVVNIFIRHFGIGDLVFLIVVTPLFSNRNFILFFITGIVFSGCMHVLMSQIKRSGETIPLAGYLSVYLILIKTADLFIQDGILYNDII